MSRANDALRDLLVSCEWHEDVCGGHVGDALAALDTLRDEIAKDTPGTLLPLHMPNVQIIDEITASNGDQAVYARIGYDWRR